MCHNYWHLLINDFSSISLCLDLVLFSLLMCNKVDKLMVDSSDSEIHTCVLSSLAHPTYFPWGLGQWTGMAMRKLLSVNLLIFALLLRCAFLDL